MNVRAGGQSDVTKTERGTWRRTHWTWWRRRFFSGVFLRVDPQ
jgi:hypothetical protein